MQPGGSQSSTVVPCNCRAGPRARAASRSRPGAGSCCTGRPARAPPADDRTVGTSATAGLGAPGDRHVAAGGRPARRAWRRWRPGSWNTRRGSRAAWAPSRMVSPAARSRSGRPPQLGPTASAIVPGRSSSTGPTRVSWSCARLNRDEAALEIVLRLAGTARICGSCGRQDWTVVGVLDPVIEAPARARAADGRRLRSVMSWKQPTPRRPGRRPR